MADLDCNRITGETLFVLELAEGYGLGDGFRIVFCVVPSPEPDGTICVLAVLGADEPLTATTLEVLRGRERIARERLSVEPYTER